MVQGGGEGLVLDSDTARFNAGEIKRQGNCLPRQWSYYLETAYDCFLFLFATKPIKPEPSNKIVAGSGIGAVSN